MALIAITTTDQPVRYIKVFGQYFQTEWGNQKQAEEPVAARDFCLLICNGFRMKSCGISVFYGIQGEQSMPA